MILLLSLAGAVGTLPPLFSRGNGRFSILSFVMAMSLCVPIRWCASSPAWLVALLGLAAAGCKVASDGQNLQGVRLYQQGQYDAAMQEFQKALANHPDSADAYYNMAATLHKKGIATNDKNALTQAETYYNKCLDLNEDHTECYRGLAVLLTETGRSDRAFNLMKNWAVRKPQSADARIELARLYEEFGDSETAQLNLTEALQIDPHDARAWNALGKLREQAGDQAQALANYQHSLQINNLQPQIAERVAVLNQSIAGAAKSLTPTIPMPGATNPVNVATPATGATIQR